VMGGGLAAIALWLGRYDMARRTVQTAGLTRFIATCLLAGYVWLGIGGGLALYFGNTGAGFVYDATLHAVFVGFVFSMIFGHAPVIFPSVLGLSIPYRPAFYAHVGLLHASLLLRAGGDLALIAPLRRAGAWGNVIAVLLFLGLTILGVVRGPRSSPEAGRAGRPSPARGAEHTAASSAPDKTSDPDAIPDLDLPDD